MTMHGQLRTKCPYSRVSDIVLALTEEEKAAVLWAQIEVRDRLRFDPTDVYYENRRLEYFKRPNRDDLH